MLELPSSPTGRSPPTCAALVMTSSFAQRASCNNIREASLLRGVPLTKILERSGKLLVSPSEGWQYQMSETEAEALFNTSCETQSLDWFVSHAWVNGRWMKYTCILFVLNNRAMFIVMNITSAIWLTMTLFGVPLPTLKIEMYFGHERAVLTLGMMFPVSVFTYTASCVFIHKVNTCLADPVVFLDKCCIHQLDPARKAMGISKLGGFLHQSQHMLVLWSPEYFGRLWCIYELACYSSLKDWKNIAIIPVIFPVALCTTLVVAVLSMFGVFVAHGPHYVPYHAFSLSGSLLPSVPMFLVGMLCGRLHRRHMFLHQQFKRFKLADTKCYCCSVNHRLPDNGSIPCDRVFIEDNIKSWFARVATAHRGDGIKAFEEHVRENLGEQVAHQTMSAFVKVFVAASLCLASWHGLEVGNLTVIKDGWLCPRSNIYFFWISCLCFSLFAIGTGQLILRYFVRKCGCQVLDERHWMLDLIAGFFSSVCFVIMHQSYLRFWWHYRKDFVLIPCVAAALGAMLLAWGRYLGFGRLHGLLLT